MAKKSEKPVVRELLGEHYSVVEQFLSAREREDALKARSKNFQLLIKSEQERVAQVKTRLAEQLYKTVAQFGNPTDTGVSIVGSDIQISVVVKYQEQFSADHSQYGTGIITARIAELQKQQQELVQSACAEHNAALDSLDAQIAELQQARREVADELQEVAVEALANSDVSVKLAEAQRELDALHGMQRKLGIVQLTNPTYTPTIKIK